MADVTPELERAKSRAEERLLALPGVTGVDIGFKEVGGQPTDQVAIRVLVEEKKPTPDVPENERVPETIDGFPSDVIQRRFELHGVGARIRADAAREAVDGGLYNPLRGGVSIGPCREVDGFVHAGTLGAIVIDNASRRRWALSNFHVLCVDDGAEVGDTVAQPSQVEGGRRPAHVMGTLRRHALTDSVDAAVADILPGRAAHAAVVEIGSVTGIGTAVLGQPVRKRGRTTRLTHGVVDAVQLTVTLDYGPAIGMRTLRGQIGIRPDTTRDPRFSAEGDSGSVVVNEAREVVGLLFGGDATGYAIANQITDVLAALDISVASQPVAKRTETPLAGEPAGTGEFVRFKATEQKDEFGKELKFEKNEDKENKDEAKEGKEFKDGKDDKDFKDGKDGKDDKDKEFKDEAKENKDETKEGKEFKDGKDEAKDSKDSKENKDEVKEAKDGKDDPDKTQKDDQDKTQKDDKDGKDGKDDKDGKDGKDDKDGKDEPDKTLKDSMIESPFSLRVPGSVEQRLAALEATVNRWGVATYPPPPDKDRKRETLEKLEKERAPEVPKRAKESEVPGRRRGLPVEQRVASLEATVSRLSHFIERSLRPDLSRGALHQEPDVAAHGAALARDADEAEETKNLSDTPAGE